MTVSTYDELNAARDGKPNDCRGHESHVGRERSSSVDAESKQYPDASRLASRERFERASRGESFCGFTIRVFFFPQAVYPEACPRAFSLSRALSLSLFHTLSYAASTNGNAVAWMRDVRVRCDSFVRE